MMSSREAVEKIKAARRAEAQNSESEDSKSLDPTDIIRLKRILSPAQFEEMLASLEKSEPRSKGTRKSVKKSERTTRSKGGEAARQAKETPEQIVARLGNQDHTCPNCGKTQNVGQYHGFRIDREVVHKQSWCDKCRRTTNYHAKPRKNKVGEEPGGRR